MTNEIPDAPAFDATETYTRTQAGGVIRGSDGAAIPPDEHNSDWRAYLAWEASGKAAAHYAAPFDVSAVAAECQRRIYAVASQNCVNNMNLYFNVGSATDADRQAAQSALVWINEMRATFAALVAAQDATFADDVHWPAVPAGVPALASRF